jgi:hypothetical protein
MNDADRSPKQRARELMQQRQDPNDRHPLKPEEIRRQMGWDLAEQDRMERERHRLRNR